MSDTKCTGSGCMSSVQATCKRLLDPGIEGHFYFVAPPARVEVEGKMVCEMFIKKTND